jgi:hypothetical protein
VVADDDRFAAACAAAIEAEILAQGPETVAAVFLEPLQNTGGCFVPPPGYFAKVREICDRHGVLLVSDEVICGFGRLGAWFGTHRYGFQPDMITFAKGVTSGYAPLGGVICRDFLAEPFLHGEASYAHGITFAGHPVSCAVGLANLDLLAREGLVEHVAAAAPALQRRLDGLRDLPVVGDVRGDGFFWAIEMVKDAQDHSVRFTPEERRELVRTVVAPGLHEGGLICRADDRVDPVIQVSPILLFDEEEFDEMETILRAVLTEATKFLAHKH